ncbi:L,D-transpeptidase family protein [Desulfobacula sp.]|uniref:L,D-transpeptidase family protein n=1 Tax=Desulfobacula sp. TaxID=2593537 RepID=UPI002609B393|nr:L,D-transpeptidase family protein [Desulfobacula sp.]
MAPIAFCAGQPFPSTIIQLPENEPVILVEKKSQTLFVYGGKTNALFVLFQAPCSTGEAYGDKLKAGDKRTPEGIYFLKNEYEDKYLSPIYGKKAFPTDYPNFLDKRAGKSGSAIWIHGTNKPLKPRDSNGCIALENSDILKLSGYVSLDKTPVIIVQEIKRVESPARIKQAQDIGRILTQWTAATENGSHHDYVSFYSPEDLPDIHWWDQWLSIRKQANKPVPHLRVKMDTTGIYYHNRVFVVVFDYFLTHKNNTLWIGEKKLFLENQNDQYKIIGEMFQTVSKKFESAKTPLIAAARTLIRLRGKKEPMAEAHVFPLETSR